jgi:hypothetical protein
VFQGAKAPRQVLVASIDASQAPRRHPEARLAKHVQQLNFIPAEEDQCLNRASRTTTPTPVHAQTIRTSP